VLTQTTLAGLRGKRREGRERKVEREEKGGNMEG